MGIPMVVFPPFKCSERWSPPPLKGSRPILFTGRKKVCEDPGGGPFHIFEAESTVNGCRNGTVGGPDEMAEWWQFYKRNDVCHKQVRVTSVNSIACSRSCLERCTQNI